MTQWRHDMMVCMQASPQWIAWWNRFEVGLSFVPSNVSGHPEDPLHLATETKEKMCYTCYTWISPSHFALHVRGGHTKSHDKRGKVVKKA